MARMAFSFLDVLFELLGNVFTQVGRTPGRQISRDFMPSERPLLLHNTLSSSKEAFALPAHAKTVRMYNCGPTVYGRQHIGNLSMFVFTDVLRLAFEYNNYQVKQVINFTDFGHLSGDNEGDADHGEDRMTKGLKREGMKPTLENMAVLAQKYADIFLQDIADLHINTKKITFPYASAYIPAQIAMIKTLEEKGYAYTTPDGVYFDTSQFPDYGKLGNIDLEGLKEGARIGVSATKRNPTDFLLWKSDKKIGWDSPWGLGFPGWHIECSAMIRAILGEQIDVHTGGIEHIPVHHNNEIAQSEAATGKKPFSRFWMHRAHIQIDGGKIAKSKGKAIYLSDLTEKGFHPLSFRYLLLGAHYRTSMNFTWEALQAAQSAYARLLAIRLSITDDPGAIATQYQERFHARINDDLDTPGALAVLWEMVKDDTISDASKLITLLDADRVLNLNLAMPDAQAISLAKMEMKEYVPESVQSAHVTDIVARREEARASKRWEEADALRDELSVLNLGVEDTPNGPRVYRKS
jgi:cysteinyl-tRNA synthetase